MTLQELFAQTLRVPLDGITEDASPRTLRNWDSLVHLDLIAAIERHYHVRLTAAEIAGMRSLRAASEILRRRGLTP